MPSVVSWQPKKREIAVASKEKGWWGCYNEYAPNCKRKGMVMNMLQIASVVSWQPKKREIAEVVPEPGHLLMGLLATKEKGNSRTTLASCILKKKEIAS